MHCKLQLLTLVGLLVTVHSQWNLQWALGKWYQIADVPQWYEQTYSYCTTALYELAPSNQSVIITNSARDAPSLSAQTCTVYGKGTPDSSNPTQWNMQLWLNPCNQVGSGAVVPATLIWNAVYPQTSQYQIAFLTSPGTSAMYILARQPYLTPNQNHVVNSWLQSMNAGNFNLQIQPTVQQGCWP